MIRLGVDLGGTKIEIVAIDGTGKELLRRRVPTPRDDYGAILASIAALVAEAEAKLGARGTVGIGTPGALSPRGGMLKNSNTVCLIGKPLLADLERVLGRSVRMANDANCLALSESVDGAGAGLHVVFAVILGTGVGGGIAVGGHVLTGPNAIAGEWGHNALPWPRADELPGPPCYCGRRGCIETFLSGPGLVRDHLLATGVSLAPAAIVAAASAGDPGCLASLERYEERLARGLASVVNLLDPDVIVLAGGLSNIGRLYDNVPGLMRRWVFSDGLDTPLVPAKHGDSSGVRGAAWLWLS